jgi:hypothetical protein
MSILIDYSGVAIANIFAMKLNINEQLIRHMILNSLRMYNMKYRGDYGQLVLVCDGGAQWRREIYPHYKAHREKGREESGLDWNELFGILNSVQKEIEEFLPFKVVQVMGMEADDIIATLCEKTQDFGQHEEIMIISADRDFIQLQKYPNVRQYSPMIKGLIKEKNPIRYLQEKILRGDGGDGVPNVLSPDDTFITGARQKTLHAKKLDQWISVWTDLERHMTPEIYKNFIRNRAMIDMDYIPVNKKTEAINTFEMAKTNSNILSYLISKRCTQLIECAEEFKSL